MFEYPVLASQGKNISLVSVPKYSKKFFTDVSMIENTTSPMANGSKEVIGLADALECIASAERTLKDMSCHPRDLSMIVVDAKALEKMDVMLLRLPNRQPNLNDREGSIQAREEASISVELAKQIKPLAAQIRAETVSAEEVYQALTKTPNPDLARKLLVGTLRSESVVTHAREVLIAGDAEVMGKISIPARDPQYLKVKITQLDCQKHSVTAMIVKFNEPSEIFSANEFGLKTLSIRVADSAYFFLLHQTSALAIPVDVTVVLDLAISSKGFAYSGSLVSVKDSHQLATRLQSTMNERSKSLFD